MPVSVASVHKAFLPVALLPVAHMHMCKIVSQLGPVSDLGLRLRRYRVGSGNRISDIGLRGTLCKFQTNKFPKDRTDR